MKKSILVKELRARQTKIVPKHILDIVPDEIIIQSYMKCSTCGAIALAGQELERFIVEAIDTEEFFRKN